jgi:uncharacterized delta-60 repeat protein
LAVQPDGKILLGGFFTAVGGQERNHLGRLNPDGSVDGSFNPGTDSSVFCVAVQPDGKILVAGDLNELAGQPRAKLGRLNADGTLDTGFNPGADSAVYALALQPDGKILLGGEFSTVGGQARNHIARLNANGSLDTGFNPQVNIRVFSLAIQPDGRILVGGEFRLRRLNANGSVDSGFNPEVWDNVYSLALQTDGKILVGGAFTALDGRTRNFIGRLNADATLDSAFAPEASDIVLSLGLQADGKILVGGGFTQLAGRACNRIGRLNNTHPATQSLNLEGPMITWLRGGSSPEVWRTTFERTPDGTNWVSVGAGSRVPGGWQCTNNSTLPSVAIRARGFLDGGYRNASSYFVESTLLTSEIPPTILVNDGSFGVHSNQFGFNVRAIPGQAVVIEASTDLVNWVSIQTNVVTASGLVSFTDPESGLLPRRFYRVRLHTGSLPAPAIGVDGSAGFQAGQFGFDVNGVAGQTVVIEASTDLANWSVLATNLLGAGPLYFSDSEATNLPARFYRARVWP